MRERGGARGLLRGSRGARLSLREDAADQERRPRRDLDRAGDHQQHPARRPRRRHHRAGLGDAGDELVHQRDLGTLRHVPGARSLAARADRRVGTALQQDPGRDPARLARELDAALDRRWAHLGAARAEHRLRPTRTGAGGRRRVAVRRHRRGGRARRGAAGHVHRRGAGRGRSPAPYCVSTTIPASTIGSPSRTWPSWPAASCCASFARTMARPESTAAAQATAGAPGRRRSRPG